MRKIICKKVYDTDEAELICKYTSGNFGDDNGYEEDLYRMPDGAYFTYGKGGAGSPYPEEKIARISEAKTKAWIEAHS